MGRPADYQWQPLGYDIDPVPGDPGQISREAQHLASVATQITDQVAVLRKIASDNVECGDHANVIRSQASDLAGQLDKIVGRYQKVSSLLNSWVPDLEQAQSMSIQALNQAEGPYQKLNNTPAPQQTPILLGGNGVIAQHKQGMQNYHNAMNQAAAQLGDAKALLDKAIALRDSSGTRHADLINAACDDGMRDQHSFWGDIAGFFTGVWSWVAKHWSQILGDLCTVLEVLATVGAIIAFVIAQFIPGLDVVVDALVLGGLIATGVATGGRIVLAATHHGSWADVGIDAFALVTFGVGRLAGVAAKAMVPGIEAAAKSAYASELLTAFAEGGPRAAMLTKFADQEGVGAVEMAYRLAEHAPTLAKGADLAELSKFSKVMMNLGGFGGEEDVAARLLHLGSRFTTPISDLSQYVKMAKTLTGVTGISAGTAGLTGTTATVMNGIELDWGNWKGIVDIPALHNWYTSHIEVPTGAPAGG